MRRNTAIMPQTLDARLYSCVILQQTPAVTALSFKRMRTKLKTP
ncbi:MAG: hypothetical protein WAO71_06955 [Gallionella sp.]